MSTVQKGNTRGKTLAVDRQSSHLRSRQTSLCNLLRSTIGKPMTQCVKHASMNAWRYTKSTGSQRSSSRTQWDCRKRHLKPTPKSLHKWLSSAAYIKW